MAREGAKYNIVSNAVAPIAGTNMTRTVWSEENVTRMNPDYVAPLLAALCSVKPPATGQVFETGGGWIGHTRWQRARGVDFDPIRGVPSVEQLAEVGVLQCLITWHTNKLQVFPEICDFDNGKADNPDTPQEGSKYIMGNAVKGSRLVGHSPTTGIVYNPNQIQQAGSLSQENPANRKYIAKIQKVMTEKPLSTTYAYSDRDAILYNITMGAHRTDLDLVYEGSPNFHVLPTFGIVPTYGALVNIKDIVPNFDPRMLLHGEQFLEIKQFPIPTSGTLKTESRLIEVVDKGNAALVRRGATTFDASGKPLFVNESVVFIRGSGGFGGQKKPSDRGAATATNTPPSRTPDKIVKEKIPDDSVALYRLLGDRNPLHIDPKFSSAGGFPVPILHGLATFGISGKHLFQSYGPFRTIKVRFSGTVLPGQTIITEMWSEKDKIVYQVKVKETGKLCITNAAVELFQRISKL